MIPSPFLSSKRDVEPLPLQVSTVRFHDMLVTVLQKMVSADVELEARALGKTNLGKLQLERLELAGKVLLLALERLRLSFLSRSGSTVNFKHEKR